MRVAFLRSARPNNAQLCMRTCSGAAASPDLTSASLQSPPPQAPRFNAADADDTRHTCPCCGNDVRGRLARTHLRKCAPEVVVAMLDSGPWPPTPEAAFRAAAAGEAATLAQLKQLRFRESKSWEETSAALRVPLPRVRLPCLPHSGRKTETPPRL